MKEKQINNKIIYPLLQIATIASSKPSTLLY